MMEEKEKAWKTVSSKYLFRRPWLTVRCEDMLLPNGNHIPEYYILEYPDWVNTIAITKDGKFVFVRQYRPGLGRTSYELCAGVCDKEDASPLVSAQRELWEETGYGKGNWQEYICLLYTSDAADELDGVDLGGRRIIKKKFFQAEDGIRDQPRSRGLGDVYKRQSEGPPR